MVRMVTPRKNNLEIDIQSELLSITSETSEQFVAEPRKADTLSDLIIGLKRYKNAIRWKEFFINNPCKDLEDSSSKINSVNKYDINKTHLHL